MEVKRYHPGYLIECTETELVLRRYRGLAANTEIPDAVECVMVLPYAAVPEFMKGLSKALELGPR